MNFPRVTYAPLSLHADKRASDWFRKCYSHSLAPLATPTTAVPQDYSGIIGVLSNVATWLQNAEALHPVVTAQREDNRETKGWYRLHPTSQYVIIVVSASYSIIILSALPQSIHRLLNSRNATMLNIALRIGDGDKMIA